MGKLSSWMSRAADFIKAAYSLWGAIATVTGLTVAALMSFLASQLDWFWFTYKGAGILGVGLLTLLVTLVCLTLLRALVSRPSSFMPDWPDAIRCTWKEEQSSRTISSTFIFYLKGEAAARREFGRVMMYFLPGGQRGEIYPDGRQAILTYLPHELWFSINEKQLIRPEAVGDDRLDLDGILYKRYFLSGVDCGGETIEEIKRIGNAFTLAREWK